MAYSETFITVAPDSSATTGIVPVPKRAKIPAHVIQYELLTEKPYHYTHDDLVYEVYVRQQGYSAGELADRGDEIRVQLLSKGHPCMRASALTKQYGWGAHYDQAGRIALYAVDSDEYRRFVETLDGTPNLLSAMRRKRA